MNLIFPLLYWSIVSHIYGASSFSMDSTYVPTGPCRPLQSNVVDFSQDDLNIDLKLLPFSCLRQVFMRCNDNGGLCELGGESSSSLIQALIRYGVALIDLSGSIKETERSTIPANAFNSARFAMDQIQQPDVSVVYPFVPTDDSVDSAHVYGYHRTGGMISKRYNQFREGFVFSDSMKSFDVSCSSSVEAGASLTSFQKDCCTMFELLHDVANVCLIHIANHFHLPNDWFQQQYGPTIDHSQWHMKRYVWDESLKLHREDVLLPTHSDPSLVSVVILDQPDIQAGAMGLQFLRRVDVIADPESFLITGETKSTEWIEVPWSGHKIAIVFVGSVLQHVTNGYFMASKHRVVYRTDCHAQPRMAATLFCRPAPSAYLVAPNFQNVITRRRGKQLNDQPITFADWLKKTAKNYEKATNRRACK